MSKQFISDKLSIQLAKVAYLTYAATVPMEYWDDLKFVEKKEIIRVIILWLKNPADQLLTPAFLIQRLLERGIDQKRISDIAKREIMLFLLSDVEELLTREQQEDNDAQDALLDRHEAAEKAAAIAFINE